MYTCVPFIRFVLFFGQFHYQVAVIIQWQVAVVVTAETGFSVLNGLLVGEEAELETAQTQFVGTGTDAARIVRHQAFQDAAVADQDIIHGFDVVVPTGAGTALVVVHIAAVVVAAFFVGAAPYRFAAGQA